MHPAAAELEDTLSWQELAQRVRPLIASRVAPDDVDDVVQETLVRVAQHIEDLRDGSRLGPWMLQVARNTVADHHRKLGRTPTAQGVSDDALLEHAAHARHEPSDDSLDGRQAEQALAAWAKFSVQSLPEPYKEALVLTELEGMSQKEAAEQLGISYTAMKSRVQRGRVMLREKVERCCAVARDGRGHIVDFEPRVPGGCRCD